MRLRIICTVILFISVVGSVLASEVLLLGEYKRHDIRVTSVCVEGHVVVVSHSDVGQGGGLHMFQLQQLVDGKIVPMLCDKKTLVSEN